MASTYSQPYGVWLAMCVEHSFVPDVTELFGPCSLVRHSSMPSILSSHVVGCMPPDCMLHNDTCAEIVDSILNKLTTEVATKAFGIEFHLLMEQVIEVTSGTSSVKMTNQMLL